MMLVKIKGELDRPIGQRSAGYESDVMHSLSPRSRDHKRTWEIRNKTLPKVMTVDAFFAVHCRYIVSVSLHNQDDEDSLRACTLGIVARERSERSSRRQLPVLSVAQLAYT